MRQLALCIGIAGFVSQSVAAGEAEVLRLRREYPSARKRLEQAYERVEASGIVRRVKAGKASSSGVEVQVYVGEGMRKLTMQDAKPAASSQDSAGATKRRGRGPRFVDCLCVGPGSMFEVKRRLDGNAGWFLTDITERGPGKAKSPSSSKLWTKFNETAGKYLYAPFRTNGWSLKTFDFLDGAKYRIVSAEPLTMDGDEVLRVRYASVPKAPVPQSGTIELLPQRGWVVRHHEFKGMALSHGGAVTTQQPYTIVTDIEYQKGDDALPKARTVRYTASGSVKEMIFDSLDFGVTKPTKEFTLAHFGLPDVTSRVTDPSRSHAIYWPAGVGFLVLIAAFVIRRRQA